MNFANTSLRGFSLIEVLIASVVVSSAIAGLAHLIAIGARQTAAAHRSVSALSLAQSQLERLRGVAWTYDANGDRVSSAELALSPASSLVTDHGGYVDAADRFGNLVSTADVAMMAFRRRWAVWRLDPSIEDTLVLKVCVFAVGGSAAQRVTPDACVSTIRTRKP